MLITELYLIWTEGLREPNDKGGSHKPVEWIDGMEQLTVNALSHCATYHHLMVL